MQAGEPGQTMDLPQRAVGRVIGRGGETIRNIQASLEARARLRVVVKSSAQVQGCIGVRSWGR